MLKTIDCDRGIYLLEIFIPTNFKLEVRKFRDRIFCKGYYYYIGSAQKNLIHRVNRHIRKNKILHWHIDHITSLKKSQITNIILFPEKEKSFECILTTQLLDIFPDNIAISRFGNSDCNICESHLFFSHKKLNLQFVVDKFAGHCINTIF